MAKSEIFTYVVDVPEKASSYKQDFEIPYGGTVKQIMFQAVLSEVNDSMGLTFKLRCGGDILFPSNVSMHPIRRFPVVLDVDFKVTREAIISFIFDSNQALTPVNITLVVYKEGEVI